MQQMLFKTDLVLMALIKDIGDNFEDEKHELDNAVKMSLISTGNVSLKNILFCLINEMESTNDVVRLDTLRNCLELLLRPES
jgi:probable RcsB/C two-component-system connector, global regulator of biofilm formation and acid-resistance